jgi:hypothetical protein
MHRVYHSEHWIPVLVSELAHPGEYIDLGGWRADEEHALGWNEFG